MESDRWFGYPPTPSAAALLPPKNPRVKRSQAEHVSPWPHHWSRRRLSLHLPCPEAREHDTIFAASDILVTVRAWIHFAIAGDDTMNQEFKGKVDQLPKLINRLLSSPSMPWSDLGRLPEKGIYMFFEGSRPLYVGRSDRIKKRLKEHGQLSSRHYSASFAFNLAKKAAQEQGVEVTGRRGELEKDPTFARLFREARERVSRMSVKVVEISDPILQTLFEVYAHLELNTKFNEFDTH